VGGGVVDLDEGLMALLQLGRGAGQGELIVIQAPLDIKVRFHLRNRTCYILSRFHRESLMQGVEFSLSLFSFNECIGAVVDLIS
jgi:hypothetical protein